VTRTARWEWAFATDAIARGDLLLLLDDEAAAEHPVAPGDRIWLLPSWRDEEPDTVKRSWWPEVSRAHRVRPRDASVPVRCLCEVVTTHSLDDDARARIAPFHPWSTAGAETARRALVVRAEARAEPVSLASPPGEHAYVELAEEQPEAGLLLALTDEAFELHRTPLERGLEVADAPRR
jgi:hypothetical protein